MRHEAIQSDKIVKNSLLTILHYPLSIIHFIRLDCFVPRKDGVGLHTGLLRASQRREFIYFKKKLTK